MSVATSSDNSPAESPVRAARIIAPRSRRTAVPGPERFLDRRRNHGANVATEFGDLLAERGGDVAVLQSGHQEDRVDLRRQATVGVRQLQLELEVAHGSQPTDHEAGLLPTSELDREALEGLDQYGAAEIRDARLDQCDALGRREERLLGGVAEHPDDQPVEEAGGSPHDVEMGVGDRIEGSGEDGGSAQLDPSASGAWRATLSRNVSVVSPNRRTRTWTNPPGSGTGVRQKCLTTTVPPSSICAARCWSGARIARSSYGG